MCLTQQFPINKKITGRWGERPVKGEPRVSRQGDACYFNQADSAKFVVLEEKSRMTHFLI